MNRLFQRYYEKTANEAELQELMEWMSDPANEPELTRFMRERWESLEAGAQWMDAGQSKATLDRILPPAAVHTMPQGKVSRLWPRVAAAAAIILLLSGGAYMLLHKQPAPIAAGPAPVIKNDVPPGGNRATLTLANGATIVLDSAGRGLLAQQGATSVNKLQDGELVYDAGAESNHALGLNTISTPRGGQYQVVLPDGSRVWLNAASSLRFPTAFIGQDRPVMLKGEAYFEVAKDRDKPFLVIANNGMTVKVLGTHFNVMSYDDESAIRTSLLEGKVNVSFAGRQVSLSPSEQSGFDKKEQSFRVEKDADMDKAVAWKNGLFDFEEDDIQTVMRQLARWYDINIVYAGAVPSQHYTGYIRRQVPISQVLNMLELTGGVAFTIEGNTVTVKTK